MDSGRACEFLPQVDNSEAVLSCSDVLLILRQSRTEDSPVSDRTEVLTDVC
jgi:hypothetical protein